tara:strand:+ start:184 stop:321 length:138 start_codon:yes stop_codon:yes gene_type:complete
MEDPAVELPLLDGPANNCQFRMILKIILKKKEKSSKQQADYPLDN